MMIGSAFEALEDRDRAALCHFAVASGLVLELDEVFGQLGHRHVLGQDLGDDGAAIEHDQPVGDLVDVGEIVLDVDAGAAGLFDAAGRSR